MAITNTDELKQAVKNFSNNLEGAGGLQQFIIYRDKMKKDINDEGIAGNHWAKTFATYQDYLLDSENSTEVKNKTHTLETEYILRKGSVLYCFAIVVAEWAYNLMKNNKNKRKELWKSFEVVRDYNWGSIVKNVIGTFRNEDGSGDKMRDGDISYKDAIKQMKEWGEAYIPAFDLPTAKTILKDKWDQVIKDEFKKEGKITFIKNTLKDLGVDNGKWNDEKDFIDKAVDNCNTREDIQNLSDVIHEGIAHVFINYYLDKASSTADKDKKKKYLGKIDDFEGKYAGAYQRAFVDSGNKNNIVDLRREVGEIKKPPKSPKTPKDLNLTLTDLYLSDKITEKELDLTKDYPKLERVWVHPELRIIDNYDLKMAQILKTKVPKGVFLKVENGVEIKNYIPIEERMTELYPDKVRTKITRMYLVDKGLRGTLDLTDFENLEELIINMDCPWGRKYTNSNYITGIIFVGLDKLKKLTLTNNPNDWDLARLDNLTKLEYLDLSGFSERYPTGWTGSLQDLEPLTNLKELNISYCPEISEGLESLENLEKVECKGTIYEKSLKKMGGDINAWKIINFPAKVSNQKDEIVKKINEYITKTYLSLKELGKWNLTDTDLESKVKILENRSGEIVIS